MSASNNKKSSKKNLNSTEKNDSIIEATKDKVDTKNEIKKEDEEKAVNIKSKEENKEQDSKDQEQKKNESIKSEEEIKSNENKIKDESLDKQEKEEIKQKNQSNKKQNKENKKKGKKQDSKQDSDKETTKEVNDKKEENEEKSLTKSENNKNQEDEKSNENKALEVKKSTDISKVDEKPEYVKQMLKNKKRNTIIFVLAVIIIIVLLLFSTVFALLNINSVEITKGVLIKDIDVSGLSIDEAKSKLEEAANAELSNEITLKYNNYETTINPSQIEFTYKIDDAINDAYNIGREGNIVENNYKLLYTVFNGCTVEMKYTYNEELLNKFIDDVNAKIPGLVVNPTYYIEENKLLVSKGKDGIEVVKEELKELILNAINQRTYSAALASEEVNIEIPVKDTKALDIDIEKIYKEIYKEPKDAYYETNPYKIYADEDGIDFAISMDEAKNIITSEDKEEYTIPLKISKAKKTIDDLGTEAFPYTISSFSTKYDASNTNRSMNLQIAANKINGKVLMPGEVFSFNKVVGKRTVEEGYKDAKIYADGGVVDGLAGGICQISSTLYNAVLLANLEIVERRNHSYPTSYVQVGRDATVVYGAIDFQFKNSRSYPIKITASVKNGVAEFKINGIKEENEYEIKILPVTTSSIPFSTKTIGDPTLAPGQQIVVQSGHAGYKVTTYIQKRLNGQIVSKDILSNDTYSPMSTIIRIGPGVPVQ